MSINRMLTAEPVKKSVNLRGGVRAVYDADDAGKAVGSLDEPGRRLMVQAVRDLDRDFSRAQHKKTSSVSPCRGLSARCDGTGPLYLLFPVRARG